MLAWDRTADTKLRKQTVETHLSEIYLRNGVRRCIQNATLQPGFEWGVLHVLLKAGLLLCRALAKELKSGNLRRLNGAFIR